MRSAGCSRFRLAARVYQSLGLRSRMVSLGATRAASSMYSLALRVARVPPAARSSAREGMRVLGSCCSLAAIPSPSSAGGLCGTRVTSFRSPHGEVTPCFAQLHGLQRGSEDALVVRAAGGRAPRSLRTLLHSVARVPVPTATARGSLDLHP
ncbi:hypothetical protein FB451DRAFT_68771 [Mycena latifolia]|nr:hypothetical protein FB451DRAFT_68771 [Mycena latifolia]